MLNDNEAIIIAFLVPKLLRISTRKLLNNNSSEKALIIVTIKLNKRMIREDSVNVIKDKSKIIRISNIILREKKANSEPFRIPQEKVRKFFFFIISNEQFFLKLTLYIKHTRIIITSELTNMINSALLVIIDKKDMSFIIPKNLSVVIFFSHESFPRILVKNHREVSNLIFTSGYFIYSD